MISDDDAVVTDDYSVEEIEESLADPKENYLDNFIANLMRTMVRTVGPYMWMVVLTGILVIYIWIKFIRNLKIRKELYHMDPVREQEFQDNLMKSRLKMQECYEKKLENFKDEMERKRQEKLKTLKDIPNTGNSSIDSKKSHKPDYNPLMGSGSLPSYRPPRRSGCSRGNCG